LVVVIIINVVCPLLSNRLLLASSSLASGLLTSELLVGAESRKLKESAGWRAAVLIQNQF